MAKRTTYRMTDPAFEQFEKLKAREKEIVEARAAAIAKFDADLAAAKDRTACFLNGVASTLRVPAGFLFIEEYGEFRENRKRATKKKPVASRRRRPKKKGPSA